MSKKTKKPIKPKKSEKNNRKKPNYEKKLIKILKNRPVRFGFGCISLKLKKSNQIQTGRKPSQNRKNQVTPGHYFFYFFFNSVQFQPRIDWILDQPTRPNHVSKLCLK